ncbi:MAG: MCE family protein [Candidatus Solibacter usitatus]|nr:MCE family protein [Candidatus Solibacter usitatus]
MPYPEEIRWAKFRAVAMCVTAIVLLVWLVYVKVGGMDFFEPTVRIRTFVPDATGLSKKTEVRLNGIFIGKVTSVGLGTIQEPNKRIEITLALKRRVIAGIPEDSKVVLDADNVLGDKVVNITRGVSPNPIAAGGELISPPVPEIDRADLIKSVKTMLARVDTALSEIESGNGGIGKLIKGDEYDGYVSRIRRFQSQLAQTTSTKSAAGKLLYSDAQYQQFRNTLKNVDDQLADIQAGKGQMGKLLKDPAMYDQLRESIAKLDKSLKDLDSGETPAGKFLKDDELYVRLSRQVAQLNQQMDEFNHGRGTLGELLVSARLYESLDMSMREMQTTVKEFRANPKKYLWVQVSKKKK